MKKGIIFLLFLVYMLTACQEKKSNSTQQKVFLNKEKKEKKENMNVHNTPIYRINFESYLPFELYLNDVLIDKNNSNGSVDFFETLNEYILSSGKQELKIKLYPFIGKSKVSYKDMEDIKVQIYKSPSLNDETFTLIQDIKFPNFKDNLPNFEYKTYFEVEVPYKNIGWMNSKDLTKEENLLDEVVLFYENVRTILNNGDYEKYFALNKLADDEIYKSLYLGRDKEKEDKEKEINRIIDSKGKMKKLEDYVLKYYGNGRLVRLEKLDGSSPLCADRDDVESYYNFFLHKKLDSNRLVIVR